MRKTIFLAAALALATPFAALADQTILGVPDLTCQTPVDWRLHDYGAPAEGQVLVGPFDGNLEECGSSTWLDPNGAECAALNTPQTAGLYNALCVNDRPADWDGDREFALGGAVLASGSGDGVTGGSILCHNAIAHHPQGATVWVADSLLVAPRVTVATDHGFGVSPCGDGVVMPCSGFLGVREPVRPQDAVAQAAALLLAASGSCNPLEDSATGFGFVTASFAPGADGAYLVFVEGTQGHVWT